MEGVRRAFGLCLVALAFALVVALITYDSLDPSFNVATWRLPQNWMGASGAYGADLLFETIGWAAFVLPLPLSAWGWRFIGGAPPAGLALAHRGVLGRRDPDLGRVRRARSARISAGARRRHHRPAHDGGVLVRRRPRQLPAADLDCGCVGDGVAARGWSCARPISTGAPWARRSPRFSRSDWPAPISSAARSPSGANASRPSRKRRSGTPRMTTTDEERRGPKAFVATDDDDEDDVPGMSARPEPFSGYDPAQRASAAAMTRSASPISRRGFSPRSISPKASISCRR